MVPLARIVHSLPSRKRLKIEEKRGDEAYFEAVRKELAGSPGIQAVEANAHTGSVIVHHAAGDHIWESVTKQGLFCLAGNNSPAPAAPFTVVTKVDAKPRVAAHASKKACARGEIDLRSLMSLVLVGVGIAQAIEGNIAIPALTAFWYAFNMFPRANDYRSLEGESPEMEPLDAASDLE